jgi:hypothetical protein
MVIIGSIKVEENIESEEQIYEDIEFLWQDNIKADLKWDGYNFIEN